MSEEKPAPAPWHANATGKSLLFIALVFVLRESQPLMVPVTSAVVLTFVLATPVRLMRQRGIPEFIGAGVLVTLLLASTTLLASTLMGPATQWWERAPTTLEQLVTQFDRLRSAVPMLAPPDPPAPRSFSRAPPPADPIKERIASESVTLTGVVIGRILAFSLSAAAGVILLYFLLASEHWLLSRTVEALRRRRTRALVLAGVRSAQRDIGRFLAALSLINIGVGIASGLAMAWIGLPNPLLWGAVAGILNFIPYIGPMMVGGLLLLAGVLSFPEDATSMVSPALAFIIIHAIESNLISPWFVGRHLSLSRVSVFLSVMFWGWMWGISGALLAVPILIGVRSLCKRNRRLRWVCVYLDDSSTAPSLRSLLIKESG